MLNLGVRAHDFGRKPLEDLAHLVAAQGLSCVQLAPAKAIAGFEADAGRLSPGFAVHCRDTLARFGLRIAVLGCYINLADPDEAQRRLHLARFKDYVRHARDFGCSVIATETGSLHADFSWHPDNHGDAAYQTVLESVAELVDEAEKFGVFVCIEGVERYVIHSPRRLRRLLDDIASPNLQILFDPVNLLNAQNHRSQDAIVEESFALFGERIAILHVKDFVLSDGQCTAVAAGTPGGALNYDLVLRLIKQQKPGVQILLEDTNPATIAQSVAFVRERFEQA